MSKKEEYLLMSSRSYGNRYCRSTPLEEAETQHQHNSLKDYHSHKTSAATEKNKMKRYYFDADIGLMP